MRREVIAGGRSIIDNEYATKRSELDDVNDTVDAISAAVEGMRIDDDGDDDDDDTAAGDEDDAGCGVQRSDSALDESSRARSGNDEAARNATSE